MRYAEFDSSKLHHKVPPGRDISQDKTSKEMKSHKIHLGDH